MVRTIGSRAADGPFLSNLAVTNARALALGRAEPVNSRTDSGATPAAMRVAAASTSSDVFPVPGPPTNRTVPRRPGSVSTVEDGAMREAGMGTCHHGGTTTSADRLLAASTP